MTVTTLFFASYRELAGVGELEVDLPVGATVADLISAVRTSRPGLASLPAEVAVAVNRQYSALDQRLFDADEVAFIPPVAGG